MKLHHSPIYQVTYGGGYFSHQTAELNYYLHDNCHDAHFDGDSIETAERIEIPRAELANRCHCIVDEILSEEGVLP